MRAFDWKGLAASYALEDYVERDLGRPPARSSNRTNKFWCCPFHNEDTPSFTVNVQTQRWKCFGACNESGDIFEYIAMREYGRKMEHLTKEQRIGIYEKLSGQEMLRPLTKEERRDRKRSLAELTTVPTPTIEQARKYAQNIAYAEPYFRSRAISRESIVEHILGGEMDSFHRPKLDKETGEYYGYETLDGRRFTLPRRHYTIPYMVGNEVRGINTRRDDKFVKDHAFDTEEGYFAFEEIKYDLCKRKGINSWDLEKEAIFECMYGPKYKIKYGSQAKVFNVNLLFRLDRTGTVMRDEQNRPILKPLPQITVVESEICAMSLTDAGFPAIAVKDYKGAGIEWLFSRVKKIIFIADNDGGAGQDRALSMLQATKRGEIITPPDGYKDANDLAVDGELFTFMESYRIYPSLLQKEVA